MTITIEDRLAIHELISLHGHLADAGAFDRMGEVFTADVVYDLTDFGQAPLQGHAALRDAALALGAGNPVGHHITNTVITGETDGAVHAVSKYIGIMTDGSSGSGTYEDAVVRCAEGWRISHRKITARRIPLS